MPTTTTPAEILIPATGAPTVRGVALTVRRLEAFGPDQAARPHVPHYDLVRAAAKRAIADGCVLCLRPTADRPACVGLTATHFADASLQSDFATRALVVDPYDAEGNDLREMPGNPRCKSCGRDKCEWPGDDAMTHEEASMVAVWEGSEAVAS